MANLPPIRPLQPAEAMAALRAARAHKSAQGGLKRAWDRTVVLAVIAAALAVWLLLITALTFAAMTLVNR